MNEIDDRGASDRARANANPTDGRRDVEPTQACWRAWTGTWT